MKISELMEQLGQLQGEYGDIEVYVFDYDFSKHAEISLNYATLLTRSDWKDEEASIVEIQYNSNAL